MRRDKAVRKFRKEIRKKISGRDAHDSNREGEEETVTVKELQTNGGDKAEQSNRKKMANEGGKKIKVCFCL